MQTRWLSSHCRVTRLSWPNRFNWGLSPGSRHLVKINRCVRWKSSVDCRRSLKCSRVRSTPSPMIGSLRVIDGQHDCRRQAQCGIVVELGLNALLGQLDAVALDSREAYLQRVALRRDCFARVHGLARGLRPHGNRFSSEIEGNAEHVGVLDREQTVFVQVIGLPPQCASNHLLAQQLRAECPHAEYVRHRIRVPALGQHRQTETTQRIDSPNWPCLPTVVHDLAQQVLLGDVVGDGAIAVSGDLLAPETFNLVFGSRAEVAVERVARLELLTVDQQRPRSGELVAVVVEVSE